MTKTNTYTDLLIRIMAKGDKGYPVELTLNGEGEQRGYLDPSRLPWAPTASPVKDGERLFEWLLADEALKLGWAKIRGEHPRCRLRFRIDAEARDLHAIPWELLRMAAIGHSDQAHELAANMTTPFSRYLAGAQRHGSPVDERPLKILVAIANPQDLAEWGLNPVEEEEEWGLLTQATKDMAVELTRLPQPCTLSALEKALKQGYHIFHFVGHGKYDQDNNEAVLYMADDENNRTELVNQAKFTAMLDRLDTGENNPLRLIFLSSCQTATRSDTNAFHGFAPALVRAGIPAVLAMQAKVPVLTAQAFAKTFYERLLDHGLVDLAANEARSALITGDYLGVWIPVLFMRLRNGQLFARKPPVLIQTKPPAKVKDNLTLRRALSQLNYANQRGQFRKFRSKSRRQRTGAFLVSGRRGTGKRWLLNLLTERLIPKQDDEESDPNQVNHHEIIKVGFGSGAYSDDLEGLQEQLAEKMGLADEANLAEIQTALCEKLAYQNLLIVVEDLSTYDPDPDFVADIINKFWQPLVQQALKQLPQETKAKKWLLLFLIDNTGLLTQDEVETADIDAWQPASLVRLPDFGPFREDELQSWLELDDTWYLLCDAEKGPVANAADDLSEDELLDVILEETKNGMPVMVLRKVSEWCGEKWSKLERRWLRL